MNEKYSGRDFTSQNLSSDNPSDFDGEIVGSCFAQEVPFNERASHDGSDRHVDTKLHIFPPEITPLFVSCNLDNCAVPSRASMVNCTNRKIRVMNDGRDWELDESTHRPLKCLHDLKGEPAREPENIPETQV
jgi:hypothetical protein